MLYTLFSYDNDTYPYWTISLKALLQSKYMVYMKNLQADLSKIVMG